MEHPTGLEPVLATWKDAVPPSTLRMQRGNRAVEPTDPYSFNGELIAARFPNWWIGEESNLSPESRLGYPRVPSLACLPVGAPTRNRTQDILLTRQAFYQLNYRSIILVREVGVEPTCPYERKILSLMYIPVSPLSVKSIEAAPQLSTRCP